MRDVPEAGLRGSGWSRREFMGGAGGALVGVSALGLPAGAEAATPRHGGSISVGLRSDVSRLDPHPLFPPYPTSNAVALLYNGITEVDANANIVPALAHAWEVSDDGLTWTWHIRKDVVFHSGRPMTGADVKANLDRILNPRTGAIIRGELDIVDRLDMLDDYTLRITLKYPYYPASFAAVQPLAADPRPADVRHRQGTAGWHRALQARLLETPAHDRDGAARGLLGEGC